MTPNTTADTTAKTAGGGGDVFAPVGWRCKTPHGWVIGKTQHASADESVYSQAAIDTLRAQLEAAEAKVACTVGVGDGNGRLFVHGDYESVKAVQAIIARAEAAEAECVRVADELVQMRDSWVVPTAGKPSSRRIATINEAGTMRAEDDFDNEVWARRKCATDLDKIIHSLDAARTKEAAP